MKDWTQKSLSNIGKVITGKTPSKDNPNHWGDSMPFVTPSDLREDTKQISNTERMLSAEGVQIFRKMIIPSGSIIVTCIGSDMGKVVVNDCDCVTNQQINSLIVHKDYDIDFVYYFLKNSYQLLRMYAEGGGSTMPILNKSTFERIPIVLPKEKIEQKKISAVLSALDEKIDFCKNQNKELSRMLRNVFRSWFVEFNFPTDKGKRVDSQIGEIPEGWEFCQIGEVIERINGRIGADDQSEYAVLSAVKTGELILSGDYFSKQVFSKDISKYIKLEKDDFAYNPARINIGSIGKVEGNIKGAVSPVYVAFRAKDNFTNFVSLFIKTSRAKKHIELFANGSVRQSLSFEDFASMEIVKPSEDVLKLFNETYEAIYKKINANNQQIETLKEMLDTLLPKLMSGEVRVK